MNDLSNQEPKKVGRPSGYTKEIGWYICTQLSEGKSLRNILNGMTGVSMSMVMRWLNDERYREFREQYTRAREAQAEIMADEIKDIADDDPMEEWMTKAGKVVRRDSAGVNRNRLRVDARKWVAAKLLPKKYGDHLNVGLGVLDWGQVLDGMRAKRAEKEAKENNKIGDNHDLPGETSGTTIDVEAIKVEDQPNS